MESVVRRERCSLAAGRRMKSGDGGLDRAGRGCGYWGDLVSDLLLDGFGSALLVFRL
jgi:hypothetical protein